MGAVLLGLFLSFCCFGHLLLVFPGGIILMEHDVAIVAVIGLIIRVFLVSIIGFC